MADPGFQPEWQEIEEGHWRRICQCWSEDIYEPRVDRELGSTRWIRPPSATGPSCERRDVADPAIVRAILRVHDREGFWWSNA